MKHTTVLAGSVLAMFVVGGCAQNAKPPTTAQQSASQAEKASQNAQRDAERARADARTAQQKSEEAQREYQRSAAEERQAEHRAQHASHQAGYAEQKAGEAGMRTGATEAQACPPGHRGTGEKGQANTQAEEGKKLVVAVGRLFPTNGAELSPDAKPKLNQLAALLRADPAQEVVVKGFTDQKGDPTYNRELSQRRAQAVSDYLASQGVPRDRIVTRGEGEATPASDTVEGRAMNRRVEIVVQPASGRAERQHQSSQPR